MYQTIVISELPQQKYHVNLIAALYLDSDTNGAFLFPDLIVYALP